MSRYHLDLAAGVPQRCEAPACPHSPHYESRADAFAALPTPTASEPKTNSEVEPMLEGFSLTNESVLLPADTYWIGDPGYALPDAYWEPWVLMSTKFHDEQTLMPLAAALIKGLPLVAAKTAYGDGVYVTNNSAKLGVDSGCIGALSQALIDKLGLSPELFEALGVWVETTVPNRFAVRSGLITFGALEIDTAGETP